MSGTTKPTLKRVMAVVFVFIMIGSVPAMAAAGAFDGGAIQNNSDEKTVGSSDTEIEWTNASAPIANNISDADGEVEVVVRFDAPAVSSGTSADAAVNELKNHAKSTQGAFSEWAQETQGVTIQQSFWIANAALVTVDTDRTSQRDALQALASQPNVERVHENFEVTVMAQQGSTGFASGPESAAVNSSERETTYGLDVINASEVWDEYGTKGDGTSVAVLDTGVDPEHPDIDLASDNWAEFDNDGNEVDSEPYDSDEHGTHVSGTVSGGNASGEYIGVAPETELMHGKVLDGGSGSFAAILAGMEWAVDEDADVMSMSLGASGEFIPDFIEPIQNAEASGTVVVVASGNDGAGTTGSPGNVYESFAIGASNIHNEIASFSSGGVVDTDVDWGDAAPDHWPEEYTVPNVAAPGVNIKSSVPGGDYDNTFSGTSMATPHVAGTVALMLAAADDDPSVGTVESSLEETAWKPDGEPDGQDTRYGHGIVDAKQAIDRVAADRGVMGTVTDSDGNPIEGATVSLDSGYTVETGQDGEYTLRGQESTFNYTVSAFGYANESVSVDVSSDSFVTRDITLSDEFAVDVSSAQSDTVQSGENVSLTVDTANVDQLAVDLTGNYSATNASLLIDGTPVAFGDAYAVAESRTDVTVTVETTDGVTGDISLEHTYEGMNNTMMFTTGPTTVFNDEISVAVVDTPDADYNTLLANDLESELPDKYNISLVSTDELLDVVDAYDTFVVQKFGEDHQLAEDFTEATKGADTGVIFLDQYGEWSDSVYEQSKVTGNPERTEEMYDLTEVPVVYDTKADHQILDGVAEPGESIELYDVRTGDHAWFNDFNGQVLADVGWKNHEMSGQGLAVDGLSRSVYASALGRTILIGNFYDYTNDANELLANSVEYASTDSPVAVDSGQPEQAAPGEEISVEFNVTDLEQLEIGLADDHSTLSEEELKLYVNGNIASFDQALAYDNLTTENFSVTVVPKTDAVGSVSLEHEFVAGGETVTGNTGPTAMYESPLEVPTDVETIQEAVDLATSDETITLANGTYTEQVTIDADGKHNLTIRSAAGAEATIEAPMEVDERSTPVTTGIRPVVTVRHNDRVTFEDLTIDAGGDNEGFLITDSHNVSVENTTVTNARQGIRASFLAEDTRVENVSVTDAETGVMIYWLSDGGAIEHTTVTNATVGIQSGYMSDEVSVHDNDVTDAETGIVVNADRGTVTENAITDVETGIDIRLSGAPNTVAGNVIENATVGIPMRQKLSLGDTTVSRNTIDAERGLRLYGAYTQPEMVYNDLSESETVFDFPSHTAYDARKNYLGDRTAADTIGPSATVHQPFLTEPPSDLESGPDETVEIAIDLYLEGGETYGVGVPGPSDSTIGEMFDEDFEGVVYGFDAASQSWTMLEGDDTVDSLNAMLVVAETDTRLTMDFQSPESSPPMPGSYELQDGWNFVTAPAHTDADDAYGNYVADGQPVISMFEAPGQQLGSQGDLDGTYVLGSGDAPTLSAFEGYFVFSGEDGERMPTRFGADPTADELYDSLNAEDPFGGADAEVVSATTLLNRAAGTNYSVSEARLSDVLYGQFERSLSAADDPRLALSSTANEIVTEADDDQLRLLETAMTDALTRLVDDKFAGEPEAEMMETVVQGILDDEFSSVSGDAAGSANATAPNTTTVGG